MLILSTPSPGSPVAVCQPTHHVLWVRNSSEKGQEGGWCGLMETLRTLSRQAPSSLPGKCAPTVALLSFCQDPRGRASRVIQWLRICLPVQETQVQSLLPEGLTCQGAAGLGYCDYRSGARVLSGSERPAQWGRCPATGEGPPLGTARESPRAATKTQCRQK